MNKIKIMKWVNLALMISAAIQIADSIIMLFNLLPSQSRLIYQVHVQNGKLFIILIFIHVYLNWNWIKANFFKKG